MDSRSTIASVKKRKKKKSQSSSNQPVSNALANEQIQEFICPITTDVMFEPVMISGCGHMVEGRKATQLQKCPHCRGEEQSRGITIVAVPPPLTSILARTLTADPTLWQQVYLDHDYLAEILRKDKLKTPTGERFIKLLENNSEENLNDKAPDGVECGKSVIEILASCYVGRELLRSNEKIQALVSDETKSIEVDGKTIGTWISTKEEKPEPKPRSSVSRVRLFTSSSATSSSRAAQPVHHAAPTDTVWQRVVYGNEDGVLQMLRATPRLVEQKATVTDYSERVVDDATPFQMALRAGDEIMAEKIKAIYLAANPGEGQAVLDAQFNEVFPNGYAAHLEEQKQSANQFERDVLNPLVAAFDSASIADLQAALEKRDNDSELCRKSREFKDAFHALSMQEKVYNPNHLQKVFEKYNAKFDGWYVNGDNPHRWLRLDLFWRQVIGWEERYMTANYAQSFCTGLGNMVDNHQPLQRTLTLSDYDTNRVMHFFPLDVDPSSKLGADFGFYAARGRRLDIVGGGACVSGVYFTELMSSKNSGLGRIMRPESSRRSSPRCLIQ